MQADPIAPLLQTLTNRLSEYEQSQEKRALIDAPRFNSFTYILPDENRLSRILADLLNPRGAHGQGEVFLDLFFRTVGLEALGNARSAQIKCEHLTDAQRCARRIDIVLRGREWVIGIENKPWASDQELQVHDYLEWLRTQCPSRFHLIYLSKRGCRPSLKSISGEECNAAIDTRQLMLVSYAGVANWLEECRAVCRADRVAWFLKNFADYIRESLLGELPREEEKMIVETVLEPSLSEHLPAVLELLRAKDAVRTRLKDRLMTQITSRLPTGWKPYESLLSEGRVGLKPPDAPDWHFCVESDNQGWYYGIKCDWDTNPAQRQALKKRGERVLERLRWSDCPAEWWPLWRRFDGHGDYDPPEYRDWERSVTPWIDMQNGRMAENLLGLAGQLHSIFESQRV